MNYRTGNYTLCRRVRAASFNPENLQAEAVKGLTKGKAVEIKVL